MASVSGKSLNAADTVLQPALAAGYGDSPAILWRDQTLSYTEIDQLVNRAANFLVHLGLKPDSRVAIMLHDTPEFVACYLGAMRAGGIAVAVNTRATAAEIAHIIDDSGAEILLIDREFHDLWAEAARIAENTPLMVEAAAGLDSDLWSGLGGASHLFDPSPRKADDMAFWIYTSGTTGAAKAAIHRHRDVLVSDRYVGETLGVRHGDILFATSKLFFAYALGTCIFASFRLGATTVLCDAWPTPEVAAGIIETHRPNVVFSVPTLYRNMLETGIAEGRGFNQVRHYVSAGERLPVALWERWKQATGVAILDGMGTSETVYMLLTNVPGDVLPGASGKSAPGVEVRLAPAAGCEDLPDAPPVLWAKIPSCAIGYWNRSEESAESFQQDWFCTNDIYEIDRKGHWHHQGRFGDMLKVSGQWVSPMEIEELVMAQTPVADCAAVDAKDSDRLPRIHLFAVAREAEDAGEVLAERIRNAVRARLAPHKAPKWVTFVDEIPRTATGKMQRYKLKQINPPPD